jgi:hypothetical protein
MTAKTTRDFTEAGSNAEYTLLGETQILLTTPRKDGTLLEYFNFAAKDPALRIVLDTGLVKQELGTFPMENLPGEATHHLTQAYMALRALGGDPFTLRASVAAGPARRRAPKA